MYIRRTSELAVAQASAFFPVLMVCGPRQVGKTTLLEQCERERRTAVSLDNLTIRRQAQEDPELFLNRYGTPLLIDEVQYAPQLLPFIKERVDRERKPGMYWITGSQQFALMQGVTESLAGRVGVLHLQGLSQAEKDGRCELPPFFPSPESVAAREKPCLSLMELYERIWRGSYPALWGADTAVRELFYASYLETYVERDVKQMLRVADELSFLSFMRALAAQTGSMLSYSSMARDVGVSVNTVKSWVSVLQTSGLIYLLQPYSNNLTARAVKTPKVYWTDTGLACYLTHWDTPRALEAGAYSGAIFETYVVSEVLKSYLHNGRNPALYYYRDNARREIDLLLEQDGKLYPMEIKKKSNPNKDDIRHFRVIRDVLRREPGHGAVLCAAQTHLPLTAEVSIVPVSYL